MSQVIQANGQQFFCGWVDDPVEVDRIVASLPPAFQTFEGCAAELSGTGAEKVVLLYDFLRDLKGGTYPTRNQGSIGSCVAVSSAGAIDVLQAVEMRLKKEAGDFKSISAESIYGFSRVEVGKGKLGNEDGSTGAWAATAVSRYGVLTEELLGPYNIDRCRQWGTRGVPDEYEPTARLNLVESVTRVTSWEQMRDMIANGYLVTIASSQGFTTTRDAEGFCQPSGTWNHQMFVHAIDDTYRRPGGAIQNSWGDNCRGGNRHNLPAGAFWADASVLDRIAKSGDCWAYSMFQNFKPRKLDWRGAVS